MLSESCAVMDGAFEKVTSNVVVESVYHLPQDLGVAVLALLTVVSEKVLVEKLDLLRNVEAKGPRVALPVLVKMHPPSFLRIPAAQRGQ